MDEFHAIQDNLEKAIEKDDTKLPNVTENQGTQPPLVQPDVSVREKLREIITSQKFHIVVVGMVILDCLLVISELLIDLDVIKLHDKETHDAPKVLHYLSIAVLSLFMIEIGVRIFVMRLEMLKHKLEMFDALVVVVSFILDIVFIDNEGTASGVGLLVILRLWRVTRILNGIIMSVKAQAKRTIDSEIAKREACEKENKEIKEENTRLTNELSRLQELLKQHDIKV